MNDTAAGNENGSGPPTEPEPPEQPDGLAEAVAELDYEERRDARESRGQSTVTALIATALGDLGAAEKESNPHAKQARATCALARSVLALIVGLQLVDGDTSSALATAIDEGIRPVEPKPERGP